MTPETAKYRRSQFTRTNTIYSEYPHKIKVIAPNGETNWMDITWGEYRELVKLLTGRELKPDTAGELQFKK